MTHDTPDPDGASALARPGLSGAATAPARRDRFAQLFQESRGCTRCPQLVAGRTQVVFGAGNANAALMLVGESPGAREDLENAPVTGAAAKLLDELLDGIGLARDEVFITTALKCHPPGNRDPSPTEVSRCRPYLEEQIALVEPRVVCTLGNFATRALRGDGPTVSDVHGTPEIVTIGGRTVHLVPLFHPSAALYTRSLLDTLRDDVAKLPELLARPALPQPEPEPVDEPEDEGRDDSQLGLF